MEEKYTLKIIYETLQKFGKENKARFDEIDRRFEQIDGRFEQVDSRFEQIDKRFNKMQKDMNQRFDEVDCQLDILGKSIQEIKMALKVVEAKSQAYDRKFEAIGKGALA